jgi:hypothetical protein
MDRATTILLADLRPLIATLGKDGGLNSASVYDTAQLVRLAPPPAGAWPALDWLASQQRPDGGWGDPSTPRARDLPTLAAVLALHTSGTRARERTAVHAGLAFLRRQASHWATLSDDLPVGIELLLPRLIEEAVALGLDLPTAPYAALVELGSRRRHLIAARPAGAGTPPVHSWEAWGSDPDPSLIDGSGGVGHSSAATAAWLHAASTRPDLADARASARRFLEQAAAATGTGIPGVVPGVWPIPRFEQVFGLYVLLIAGLLDTPELRDVISSQVDDLARAMRPSGIGFSDFFVPDGDDTAAALAVLRATGGPADLGALDRFAHSDHFCAFPGELHPSLSVVAHAAHALERGDNQPAHLYITERQGVDGRWPGDKWHSSWLYTTSQAVIALASGRHPYPIRQAVEALVNHQHSDGGWGVRGSTSEETAYGVLTLRLLQRRGCLSEQATRALPRAEQWMLRQYQPFADSNIKLWLDKDVYRPERIARVIELAATLPAGVGQESA